MNKKVMCVAAAIVAAFAITGCGKTSGDGGVNMDVGVAGLLENQHFCFTWTLYQYTDAGTWVAVDGITDPVCAENGVDNLVSYATCYDGRRFIVTYNVTYYDDSGQIGTATGTSGGTEADVCVKNQDAPTSVLFQFRNEGGAGGANPEVNIDQVCTNDKAVFENERAVSAVWVQPDACVEGTPDSYCVLGTGCGLETIRYGVTMDGLIRFIFSTSDMGAWWDLYYLFFEPVVLPDALILEHSPYVLHHELNMGAISREAEPAKVVFRYDDSATNLISLGFIELEGDQLRIYYDLNGTCNAGVDLDAVEQTLPAPTCTTGTISLLGAIPAGDSAFTLVFECSGGGFEFKNCNARGLGGGICE